MKRRITTILWCAMALFTACEHNVPESSKPEPAPEMGDRTVLVYIAADNSLNQQAPIDLNEMVEGIASVNTLKNNLLVYIDRRNADPQLIRICRNTQKEVMLDTLKSYTSRNSVGVEEMKEVFSYAFSRFPSDSYGLIMWSHGDGWAPYPQINTRWIGQDTDRGDNRMNILDLHAVLQQATPHLDYLFFDACSMQAAEVAYELRGCADYFIGSPTEIPGPGAPYQTVVPALFVKEDAAMSIANNYFDYYKQRYNGGKNISNDNWTGGVSISVLKSAALDPLAAATRQLLPTYIKHSEQVNTGGIMYYDRNTQKYYYDLDGLVRSLTVGSDYLIWKQAFDQAVVFWNTTEENYSGLVHSMFPMQGAAGLSTYIPHSYTSSLNRFYHDYQWYTAAGWSLTGW